MDQYKLREYIAAEPEAKLRDLVARLLHDEIVALRIAPGSRLNVNQIASSLGISRTPVAEAIASLTEQYGEIPESVIEAALELVDHQYQYRGLVSPTSISTVPYNWDLLLKPYMKL